MDLSTIEMPKEEAQARLAEYQAALKVERNAQDEALAMAYRAAARGLPVIQLSKTIAAGGFFDNGLPRLAVVRATEQECFVRWRGNDLIFAGDDWADNQGALVGKYTVRVPLELEDQNHPAYRGYRRGRTIVPLVPPRFRPRWPRLKSCHLLWEVEAWKPVPPHDPALIRHIRGDLWSVLAVWDLTELERAVLAM